MKPQLKTQKKSSRKIPARATHTNISTRSPRQSATIADFDNPNYELHAARLAAIVESSEDAIISKNLDGVIQTWNQGAERIFGYTADEIIGQSVVKLIPPERYNEEPAILERIRRGELVDHYETVRRRKDGALIDISLTISPIKDRQGTIIGASKIARDITDRKRADFAMQQYAAIVESSDDAIVSKDLDGIIKTWNDSAQRIFGYAPEEIIGKPILQLIPPERRMEERHILDRIRRGLRVHHYETVRQHRDGSLIDVSLTISPIKNTKGMVIGASKIARNITGRKRNETQQRALYDFITTINRTSDLQAIYNVAIDAILQCQGANRAAILVRDSSNMTRFVAWRGISTAYRLSVEGYSPWKNNDADPRPVLIADVPAGLEEPMRSAAHREGIRALAFIPIMYEGQLLGSLGIFYNMPHPFSREEMRPAETIAAQLALVIERKHTNAQVFA